MSLVAAFLVAGTLIHSLASQDVSVDADPKDAIVHLEGHEVRGPSYDESDSGDSGRSAAPAPSPCTFAVTLVYCDQPDDAPVGGLVFTPGMARQAVANIPLPGLALHVQPDGETLVNVPTIFWAEPEEFSTTIDLLGHEIEVQATPESYTWVHGDGTAQSTDAPGEPYPGHDITHRYWQPAQHNARVDTTYAVRYSIDGGGWSDLGETLTATGPSTTVDVHEAAPVLSSR